MAVRTEFGVKYRESKRRLRFTTRNSETDPINSGSCNFFQPDIIAVLTAFHDGFWSDALSQSLRDILALLFAQEEVLGIKFVSPMFGKIIHIDCSVDVDESVDGCSADNAGSCRRPRRFRFRSVFRLAGLPGSEKYGPCNSDSEWLRTRSSD